MERVINSIIYGMKQKYLDFTNSWRTSEDQRNFCLVNFKNYAKLLEYSGSPISIQEYDSFVKYVTAHNVEHFIEGTFLENYNDRCEPFDFESRNSYCHGISLSQLNKNWFERECAEWDKVRELLSKELNHSWNAKYCCNNDNHLFLGALLKQKSPDEYKKLISSFPKKGKNYAFYHRGFIAYCELSTVTELKPAQVRPYRSEAAGCALLAVKGLLANNNFNDMKKTMLLSKFADSKHQDVVSHIVTHCPKSALTYFVSNPLCTSDYNIKRKLSERMDSSD